MATGKRAGAQSTPGHPIKVTNAKKPAPALQSGAPAKFAIKVPPKKKGPPAHGVHITHQSVSHDPAVDAAMASPSRHTFDRVQRLGGNTYHHLAEKLKLHPSVLVQTAQQSGGSFDKFKQMLLSNKRVAGKSALNPKDDKEAKDLVAAWHSMGMKSLVWVEFTDLTKAELTFGPNHEDSVPHLRALPTEKHLSGQEGRVFDIGGGSHLAMWYHPVTGTKRLGMFSGPGAQKRATAAVKAHHFMLASHPENANLTTSKEVGGDRKLAPAEAGTAAGRKPRAGKTVAGADSTYGLGAHLQSAKQQRQAPKLYGPQNAEDLMHLDEQHVIHKPSGKVFMRGLRDTVRLLKSVIAGRVNVLDYTSTGKPIYADGRGLEGYSGVELRELAGVHRDFANRLRDVVHGGGSQSAMPHTLAKYVTDNLVSKFEKVAAKADKLVVAGLSKAIDDDLLDEVVPDRLRSRYAHAEPKPSNPISAGRLSEMFRPVVKRNKLPGPGERGNIVEQDDVEDKDPNSMWQFVQRKNAAPDEEQDPDDKFVAGMERQAKDATHAAKLAVKNKTTPAQELDAINKRREYAAMPQEDKEAALALKSPPKSVDKPKKVVVNIGGKKMVTRQKLHEVEGVKAPASSFSPKFLSGAAHKWLKEHDKQKPEAPYTGDDPYEGPDVTAKPTAAFPVDKDRHFSSISAPVDRFRKEEYPTPHGTYVRHTVSDAVRGVVGVSRAVQDPVDNSKYEYSYHPKARGMKPITFSSEADMTNHMRKMSKSLVITLSKADPATEALRHKQASRDYTKDGPEPGAPPPSKRQLAAKERAKKMWATRGGGQEARDAGLMSASKAAEEDFKKKQETYNNQFVPNANREEFPLGTTRSGKQIMSHGTHRGFNAEDVDDALDMHTLLRDQAKAEAGSHQEGSLAHAMHTSNFKHHSGVADMLRAKQDSFRSRDARVGELTDFQAKQSQNPSLKPSVNRSDSAASLRKEGPIGTARTARNEIAEQLEKLKAPIGKIPAHLVPAVALKVRKRTPVQPAPMTAPVKGGEEVEASGDTVFRRKLLHNKLRKACRLIVKSRK